MLPELRVFGHEIQSHVAMLALAVVICNWIGPRWAKALEGIEPTTSRWVLVWLGVAAFAGGRLHFLANTWALSAMSRSPWAALKVWDGLHAGGAILALVLATPLVLRLYGLSIGRFADALAPTVGVGVAIARLGCFMNGCCFGTPSNVPWAVSFPGGSPAHLFHLARGLLAPGTEHSAPIHPLQLYFAGAALAATAISLRLYGRRRYPGRISLVALSVYLSAAAAAELFRAENYPQTYFWGGTLQFQWIAIAEALGALLVLFAVELAVRRRGSRRQADARLAIPI